MPKINIPPTKSNLHKVKKTYETAKEGHDLLEQKREILVMELMTYIERTKRIEKDLDRDIEEAYSSLRKALKVSGRASLEKETGFITYEVKAEKKAGRMMGISLPALKVTAPDVKLQYSQMTASAALDEVSARFIKLVAMLAEAAQIRAIVWRLSKEVKKVQRRVNALEKVVMPENKETARYIESTLEEKERDELFAVKMVKAKLEEER